MSTITPVQVKGGSETLWMQPPTPAEFRGFRKIHGWSAQKFGRLLGISRSYVLKLQAGRVPFSEKVIAAYEELAEEYGQTNAVRITWHYRLPRELEVFARPRRCPGCRKSFIWRNARQRYCDRQCREKAKRRLGRRNGRGAPIRTSHKTDRGELTAARESEAVANGVD